jgi:hypothetical protein
VTFDHIDADFSVVEDNMDTSILSRIERSGGPTSCPESSLILLRTISLLYTFLVGASAIIACACIIDEIFFYFSRPLPSHMWTHSILNHRSYPQVTNLSCVYLVSLLPDIHTPS